MKEYIFRSLRYLLKMLVLLTIIYSLMFAFNMSSVNVEEYFQILLSTPRGKGFIVALLAMSLAYPKFGFTKRRINASLSTDSGEIIRAFMLSGYSLIEQQENKMTFRVSSLAGRILAVGEDKIELEQIREGEIVISGTRKFVVQLEFRIRTFIDNRVDDENNEEVK